MRTLLSACYATTQARPGYEDASKVGAPRRAASGRPHAKSRCGVACEIGRDGCSTDNVTIHDGKGDTACEYVELGKPTQRWETWVIGWSWSVRTSPTSISGLSWRGEVALWYRMVALTCSYRVVQRAFVLAEGGVVCVRNTLRPA